MMRRAIAMPGQSKSPWYRTTVRLVRTCGFYGATFTGPCHFVGSVQLVHGQVGDQAQVGPFPHYRRPAAGAGLRRSP